jgi:hypothetical protein
VQEAAKEAKGEKAVSRLAQVVHCPSCPIPFVSFIYRAYDMCCAFWKHLFTELAPSAAKCELNPSERFKEQLLFPPGGVEEVVMEEVEEEEEEKEDEGEMMVMRRRPPSCMAAN